MKKSLLIGATVLMGLSLAACGNSKSSASSAKSSDTSSKSSVSHKGSKKKSSSSSSSSSSTSSQATSASSSRTASVTPISADEAATLIQKSSLSQYYIAMEAQEAADLNKSLPNGGYELCTYSGAKGENVFDLTPSADGTVQINLTLATLDGGFTPQGSESATVTR